MKAFYDAVERLTAFLSFRIEKVAKARCWAVHFTAYGANPELGLVLQLYSTMVHLPRGCFVTFMPRPLAEEGGEVWHIDIRRSDGVVRPSWAGGVRIAKRGDDYDLLLGDRPLTEQDLATMMVALEKPGMSGLLLDIARAWSMRFGPMPIELALALEAIRDFDLLDQIYDGLFADAGRADIEALVKSASPAAHPAVSASKSAAPQPEASFQG